MRKSMLAGAAAIAMAMVTVAPASAQVVGPRGAASANGAQGLVTNVRWRGHHWRGHRWHHRGYWGHRHRGFGPGFGVGLGAGLLFGGLAASAQAQSSIDWCDAHYRSYDRATQTYMGYDGYRHSCP